MVVTQRAALSTPPVNEAAQMMLDKTLTTGTFFFFLAYAFAVQELRQQMSGLQSQLQQVQLERSTLQSRLKTSQAEIDSLQQVRQWYQQQLALAQEARVRLQSEMATMQVRLMLNGVGF